MKGLILALAVFVTALLPGPAAAHEYEIGSVKIVHPWARATAGGSPNGAVYMTLSVAGSEADRLLAVSTPAAKRAQLHRTIMDDGVMKMRPVDAVEIAPGPPTVMQPGGLHVMLMGLAAPLEEGDLLPLTLTFEHAGTIEVEAIVLSAGAMSPE